MSYTIEKLVGEAIVVVTINPDFYRDEGPQLMDDMLAQLEMLEEDVYFVNDMTYLRISMDDVLEGSSLMSRSDKPIFHHPRIRENVFVTTNPLFKMAAKGLSAPIFGGLQIKVFEGTQDALSYCRGQ